MGTNLAAAYPARKIRYRHNTVAAVGTPDEPFVNSWRALTGACVHITKPIRPKPKRSFCAKAHVARRNPSDAISQRITLPKFRVPTCCNRHPGAPGDVSPFVQRRFLTRVNRSADLQRAHHERVERCNFVQGASPSRRRALHDVARVHRRVRCRLRNGGTCWRRGGRRLRVMMMVIAGANKAIQGWESWPAARLAAQDMRHPMHDAPST